uniref:Retrovirus-related Pol polyprotein from transposon TNT 1-94 n=1 Tax=Vitis vinifera TaxID=29760 RepID=A0A438BTU2_VITVI|nr:Retrovirus-related Pol polyprotein from transposon TNT 1-94 [Vitis vinifera]
MITSEKLVGSENYLSWSASVELWFMGQGYEDHLVTQEADIPEVDRVQWRKIDAHQQDLDLSTYIGQIASLKEEFLTVMPLTPDILGSSSVPSLDDVFARLLRISSTQTLPFDSTSDSSVLVSQTSSQGGRSGTRGRGQCPHCTYCNKLGHTRDRCYQLHGRPPRTAHVAQSSDSPLPQPPSSSASQASVAFCCPAWTGVRGRRLAIGRESQGLYHLTSDSSPAVCISTDAPLLIHNRLGHPSLSKFQKMVPRFSTLSSLPCESCQLGKHTRVLFPKRLNNRAKSPFELVHTDVWGPCRTASTLGFSILSLSLMTILDVLAQFTSFMSHHGILHQSSCAHTPQQNGVAERKNRHLVETARTLLLHSNVPFRFWGDAVLTACYLINRMPSSVLHDQIPHSLLFPDQPLYFLPPRVFGCTCFVHILTPGQDKLSAKAMKCLFLGYSRLQKGYRCYSLETHRYFISADVTFFEDSPFFSTTSESLPVSEVLPIPIVSPPDAMPLDHFRFIIVVPRVVAPLPFLRHLLTHFLSLRLHLPRLCLLLMTYPLLFGKSTHEALSHPGWRQAMVDEMAALHSNGTWDLVVLPSGKSTVGCRWVYAVKVGPDGQIASVRLLLSMAAMCSWPLYQLDIKNVFLHGDLAEEVYMEQPPGFVAQGESGLVCRLRRSLYGLKQSPRAWFSRFSSVVQEFGMLRSSDQDGIQKLKQHLFTHFQTKDLGKLKYFLGIEIAQSSSGVVLSQRKYALDILEETGMLDCKPVDTPMDPNVKLVPGQGEPLGDPGRYRRLVGKLNYLTITRPDISFPYTRPRCIVREQRSYSVVGYTDADWAGSPTDRRSTSGYCVFIGGNLISWKSKKQDVVARSSAEAEYRAMALATCELIWLRHLLQELRFGKDEQMKLICDNQAALHIASNPVFHERTKHIEVDCHFIREKIASGCVATSFVNSNDQLADIFTKSLRGPRIKYICNKLGAYDVTCMVVRTPSLVYIYSQLYWCSFGPENYGEGGVYCQAGDIDLTPEIVLLDLNLCGAVHAILDAIGPGAKKIPYICSEIQQQTMSMIYLGIPEENVLEKHIEGIQRYCGSNAKVNSLASQYDSSEADPFILGIQTEWQLQQMIRFGHRSIMAVDSTFGIKRLKYPLCTLLVFDSRQHALPVAWIITRSFAKPDVSKWMKALLDRARGIDIGWKFNLFGINLYFRDVFCCPVLFSLWRVRRSWLRNIIKKSSNVEVQREMFKRLGKIVYSIWSGVDSLVALEEFTQDFVDQTSFIEYFKALWMPKIEMWIDMMKTLPLASQEASGAIEAYHVKLKVKLYDDSHLGALQRMLRKNILLLHLGTEHCEFLTLPLSWRIRTNFLPRVIFASISSRSNMICKNHQAYQSSMSFQSFREILMNLWRKPMDDSVALDQAVAWTHQMLDQIQKLVELNSANDIGSVVNNLPLKWVSKKGRTFVGRPSSAPSLPSSSKSKPLDAAARKKNRKREKIVTVEIVE